MPNIVENFPRIDVRRVAGRIGADIEGVDLSQPIDAETMAEIRAALLRHKVIFFRGQHLSHGDHVAFGQRFGELTRRPGKKHGPHPEGFPQILTVDPNMDDPQHGRFEERLRPKSLRHDSGWHVDLAAAVNPPAVSILRAEVVTEFGGDTQWTNLVAAYEGLSRPLQNLVDGLRAEHTPLYAACQLLLSYAEHVGIIRNLTQDTLLSVHPVVRVHPETGEKALFTPPASVTHIVGLLPWESRRILELLFEHISRPEYTVRQRWAAGDVAVWDNRAVAHLQPSDLDHTEYHRTLYRVTVLGDRPVGPDGFESQLIHGEPLTVFTGS